MNQPLPNGKSNFVIVKMHRWHQAACKYFWTTNILVATMEIYHNFDVGSILTLFLKVVFASLCYFHFKLGMHGGGSNLGIFL